MSDRQIIVSPMAASPEVQAIFDAMLAFMGDTYINLSAYVTKDGSATVLSMTAIEASGRQTTFTDRVPGQRVMVAPSGAALGPGQTAQFTASVSDAAGAPVVPAPTIAWSVAGPGAVDAAGLYTAPATIDAAITATVRAQASVESWGVAIVNLQTAAPPVV